MGDILSPLRNFSPKGRPNEVFKNEENKMFVVGIFRQQ